MIRLGPWLLAVAAGTALLALSWWGWQRMGLAALQLGMGNC
ncbi:MULTISPECIES: hypothetical protein [unclassified Pseudomonas]|nr:MULTISPECIES: hypothetical protein [unclassified Pseudomonas]